MKKKKLKSEKEKKKKLNEVQIWKFTKSRLARIKSPSRFSSHVLEFLYISQGFPLSVSSPVYFHTFLKNFWSRGKDLVSDINEKRGRIPSQLVGGRAVKRVIKIHKDLRACCIFCTRLCRENKDEYVHMDVIDSRRNLTKWPSFWAWETRGRREYLPWSFLGSLHVSQV